VEARLGPSSIEIAAGSLARYASVSINWHVGIRDKADPP